MKKSALLLFFLLLFCPFSHAGNSGIVITFPQGTRLEGCVRSNLHNSQLKPIYQEDALLLTSLACDDPAITSFEGIEQFPNLTSVHMGYQGTQIDNLTHLSALPKLARLTVPRSNITDISPLAALPELFYLDLSENHVTDLTPLDNLTRLTTLILYHQGPEHITDISPLDNLTNMYVLNLESNKITDITPLQNMHHLQYLHLRDNRIFTIEPLDNLTNLRFINLNINRITDLTPLIPSQNLTTLYANNNRITSLDFLRQLTQITHLSLNQNFLTSLDEAALLAFPVLISADQNYITDITALKKTINNGWLKELGVAYNCIPNLDKMELYRIPVTRKEHQCEAHPLPGAYELATVVNGDLLRQAPPDPQNPPDSDLMDTLSIPRGPGGCSIAGNGSYDIHLPILLCALFGLFIRRTATKKSRDG